MLLTLSYFLFALLLLVIVHEYGHFQVARWCGVKVLRFSFGFGKILTRWKDKKGTEYVISLIPLGGYVKMLDETEGNVEPSEQHLAFNRKSVWARIAIVSAGPIFNFLLAFILLWMVSVIGTQTLAPMIGNVAAESIAARAGLTENQEIIAIDEQPVRSWRDFQYAIMPHIGSEDTINFEVQSNQDNIRKTLAVSLKGWSLDSKKPDLLESLGIEPFIPKVLPVADIVLPDSPAEKAGVISGDVILTVDGKKIEDWMALVQYIRENPGKELNVIIKRNGYEKNLTLKVGEKNQDGKIEGFIGLHVKKPVWPKKWLRVEQETPINALYLSAKQTWQLTANTVTLMGRLFTGQLGLNNISGPVGIAKGAGDSGKAGIVHYLGFMALLSISLGVLNLLPVPMLDGGHLLYYLVELIIRKPVPEQIKQAGIYLGLFLLGALMIIALWNDIGRIS